MRPQRAQRRAPILALLASLALATVAGTTLVAGATGLDRSDVVLVFDVSNSILLSTDGTNKEFADALDGIADRVQVVSDDLAAGNAHISFVVFGRQAIPYPSGCNDLALHANPTAIARFETCLRSIAGEYRAGAKAPVIKKVNTADTDHVAALDEAASLLPKTTTRSAVIFFTDGKNDPPGTARDNENVVARVTPAFAGITPLAVLPVGLGAGAGAFRTELTAISKAFIRDMEPCEGRASFAWPEVVFPSADAAGTAVALALQEVTCSFTVAPTPPPTLPPTPPPAVFGPPTGIRVLAGNGFLTVQWLAPAIGADAITNYLVQCTPVSGGAPIEAQVAVAPVLETTFSGLSPGSSFSCAVAATDGITTGPYSAPSGQVVVLGIPSAPSQPGVEPLDGAARLSVPPVVGGPPIEQYVYVCTSTTGAAVQAAGAEPTVVVPGLTNGQSFQCVAYAENSVGRSPASAASASFSPCGGLFDCNPWTKFALGAVVIAAIAVGGFLAYQQYKRRNRVWITAQVDGGENRPLGWGPELGIRLVEDDAGWSLAPLPPADAKVRVRFERENRFMVTIGTRITHVHQGDPTSIRDDVGTIHQVILRRYRDKPNDRTPARPQPGTADSATVVARLPDVVDDARGGAAPPEPPPREPQSPEPPLEGQGA
jgi:Fibronectin type III domain